MKLEELKKIFWEKFGDVDEHGKPLVESTEKLMRASYENGEIEGFRTGIYAGAAYTSAVLAVTGIISSALYYFKMKKS